MARCSTTLSSATPTRAIPATLTGPSGAIGNTSCSSSVGKGISHGFRSTDPRPQLLRTTHRQLSNGSRRFLHLIELENGSPQPRLTPKRLKGGENTLQTLENTREL